MKNVQIACNLLAIGALSLSIAIAQTTTVPVLNYDIVKKKVEKGRGKRKKTRKKGSDAKTWFKLAEAYTEAGKVGIDMARLGATVTEMQIYYQKPDKVETVTEADVAKRYIVMPMPRLNSIMARCNFGNRKRP
ncbi:MAG: hypothetical protein HC896_03100 [Bacteroidales bacterium]|nr:hypothetical protein [Bacteroidales bacterium]